MSTSVQQAVEELAEEAGWSYAEVVRECIDVGLPVVKSRVTTLEELADETGLSYAEVVRECIDVGLPVVKSRVISSWLDSEKETEGVAGNP